MGRAWMIAIIGWRLPMALRWRRCAVRQRGGRIFIPRVSGLRRDDAGGALELAAPAQRLLDRHQVDAGVERRREEACAQRREEHASREDDACLIADSNAEAA